MKGVQAALKMTNACTNVISMEQAHEFDFYFNDERLKAEQLAGMQLTRRIVHDLYPEVQERVAYAMPGFFPKNATKANQQLFLLMPAKKWLGIYGTGDFADDPSVMKHLAKFGVESTTGDRKVSSLHVPYDMPEYDYRQLLQLIMKNNFIRHGVELMHDKDDFGGSRRGR